MQWNEVFLMINFNISYNTHTHTHTHTYIYKTCLSLIIPS